MCDLECNSQEKPYRMKRTMCTEWDTWVGSGGTEEWNEMKQMTTGNGNWECYLVILQDKEAVEKELDVHAHQHSPSPLSLSSLPGYSLLAV